MTVTAQAAFLRDEIVRLINDEIERTGAADPASCKATGEVNGASFLIVIDSDANCFRVTVEEI